MVSDMQTRDRIVNFSASPNLSSSADNPQTVLKIIIAVSVCGYIIAGVMSMLLINGRAQGGRGVPEWYSRKTWRDVALLVLWWVGGVTAWPIFDAVMVLRFLGRKMFWKGGLRRRLEGRKEVAESEDAV